MTVLYFFPRLVPDPSPYDCDPLKEANKNFTINSFPDGFRAISFDLISSQKTSDSSCQWLIDTSRVEQSFLLDRLTLGPNDALTVTGIKSNKGNDSTELFKGNNLLNAGFIHVVGYEQVEIILDLKKDDGGIVRAFSAQYAWKLPTVLLEPEGELTLALNQVDKPITANFSLSPPFSHFGDTLFLLN